MLELMKNQWIVLLGEWIVFSLVFGLVLFFIFYSVFKLKAVNSPKKRYGVALAAIAFLFVASIVTICILAKSKVDAALIVEHETSTTVSQQFINFNADSDQLASEQVATEATIDYWSVLREKYTPFLGIAWLLGVCLLSIRYLGGYAYLWRLNIVANVNFPSAWSRKIQTFKTKVGIKGAVSLKMSERISAPLTFGFWKPVIIVPIGFFSGLSTEQAEAILIHELYHIKHRDFIINSALSLMEIIFFYHPLMWWLLAIVREERENYCDDQTVKLMGNPMSLAKALTQVEANKQAQLAFALHFSNNKNTLTERIMRLFEPQNKRKNPWKSLVGLVLLILIFTGFTLKEKLSLNEKESLQAVENNEVLSGSKKTTIVMGLSGGDLTVQFDESTFQTINNSGSGKAFLNEQEVKDRALIELKGDLLYYYSTNTLKQEIRFFTKTFAIDNQLDPRQLALTDKSIMMIHYEDGSYSFEVPSWKDDWDGWGSKEKIASDELSEEEQVALDPWNMEAHKKYFAKGGKGLIGYHNFGWSKDAETGRYVFELVDATKEPLVLLNGKEISWKEFSAMQLKIGRYEYHIYDDKDGVENFGEKARYGAIQVKTTNEKSDTLKRTTTDLELTLTDSETGEVVKFNYFNDNSSITKSAATNPFKILERLKNQNDSIKNYHVVIDGKPLPKDKSIEEVVSISDIRQIDVKKGEAAMALFGEKAKDGALVISTADRIYSGKDENVVNGEDATINNRAHVDDQNPSLKVIPGEKISKSVILRTQQEIAQLGYFDKEGGKSTNSKNNTNDKNNAPNDPDSTKIKLYHGGDKKNSPLDIRGLYFKDSNYKPIKPLIVLDGKIINYDDSLKALDPSFIDNLVVLKNQAATKKYGKDGEIGVIEIYSKDYMYKSGLAELENVIYYMTENPEVRGIYLEILKENHTNLKTNLLGMEKGTFWVVVDGKRKDNDFLDEPGLDPSKIKSARVIKGETAKTNYGKAVPKNGVIEIVLIK